MAVAMSATVTQSWRFAYVARQATRAVYLVTALVDKLTGTHAVAVF